MQKNAIHTHGSLEGLENRTLLSAVYPTASEQYWLELTNRARANPLAEAARFGINLNEGLPGGTISSTPKQPLAFNPYLAGAARTHAQHNLNVDYLTHYGAGGIDLKAQFQNAGYTWVWPYKGMQNIAWVHQTADPSTGPDYFQQILFVDTVASNRGHRTTIMDGSLDEVGMGIGYGNFAGNNAQLGVMDFAYSNTHGSDVFLTGVVFTDGVNRNSFYTPGEGMGGVTITARRSDGATFSTQTWGAGGYTLRLGQGTYTITASGGGLASAVSRSNVYVGNDNVKVDFIAGQGSTTNPTQPPPPPTATQSPFSGSPIGISGTGSTRIEAENFDKGGEGIAYHDAESTNFGGRYRAEGVDIENCTEGGYNVAVTKAGEWLEYTINVATNGTYDLDFRVASNGTGGVFHAEIDGTNVTGTLAVPNTGGWMSWTDVSKNGVNLTAGTHVLRVAFDSNGATGYTGNLNHITISPAEQAPLPSNPGSLPTIGDSTTIQAEDFDAGADGVAYHDTESTNLGGKYRNTGVDIQTTGDTGGGHTVGWIRAGEWMQYTVNVAKSGTYDLDFRVASNGTGGSFHVEVDRINVTGSLSVPNTGGWDRWHTLSKSGINLSAGQHTIRVAFDTNGSLGFVGNLNWFNATLAGATSTPTTPQPGQSPFSGTPINIPATGYATIEAENFDNGGEGIAYHDNESANYGGAFRSTGVDIQNCPEGGYTISHVRAGEWLEYTVNVAQAGTYNMDFRVASLGGSMHIEVDGANVGGIALPNTGWWDKYRTITKSGVSLSAGTHVVRVAFDAASASGYAGNLNWFRIGR